MAISWLEDLVRYDRSAIFAAAREWGGLRFPAAGEFVAACKDAARRIADDEARRYAAGELTIGACTEGCEAGWIYTTEIVLDGRYTFARPCELCRPIAYAVWRHRTSRADHDPDRCADCISIKRNKEPTPAWLVEARELAAQGGRVEERF